MLISILLIHTLTLTFLFASPPNPSSSHGSKILHSGSSGSCITDQLQQEVKNGDVKVVSIAYVSGFMARHVLRVVRCYDCKTCVMSPMMLSTSAFI